MDDETSNVTELAPYKAGVAELVQQAASIQECMKTLMKRDEHYGVIPGTPKASLWQPGADKLCLLFRLRPEYEVMNLTERDDWIAVTVRCRLVHINTKEGWGEGIGSANTREKKYTSQTTAKVCPKCQKPAIIKGRDDYGGGWLCYAKKDGCGAKFKDGDKTIEEQKPVPIGLAVWDLHNTIMKMACKRAKVAAVLTATAASDIFTQDLEDLVDYMPPPEAKKRAATFSAPRDTSRSTKKWSADPKAPAAESAADQSGETDVSDTGVVTGAPVTKKQIKLIHVLKEELKYTREDWESRLTKHFGKKSSADLTVDEAANLIDRLQETKRIAAAKTERQVTRAKEMFDDLGSSLQAMGVDVTEDRGDEPTPEEWAEMNAAMERDAE